MSFTTQDFRKALGLFPTGVAIVSARTGQGELLGMTVSSFNSVSLDPPLVLFSVAKSAQSYPAWNGVERFAVNVLARGQDELSSRFARSQADKWSQLRPVYGAHDIPLVPGALASFECERWAVYDGGDHAIVVGRVLDLAARPSPAATPLVFFAGRYCGVDREHGRPAEGDDSLWHGWA